MTAYSHLAEELIDRDGEWRRDPDRRHYRRLFRQPSRMKLAGLFHWSRPIWRLGLCRFGCGLLRFVYCSPKRVQPCGDDCARRDASAKLRCVCRCDSKMSASRSSSPVSVTPVDICGRIVALPPFVLRSFERTIVYAVRSRLPRT